MTQLVQPLECTQNSLSLADVLPGLVGARQLVPQRPVLHEVHSQDVVALSKYTGYSGCCSLQHTRVIAHEECAGAGQLHPQIAIKNRGQSLSTLQTGIDMMSQSAQHIEGTSHLQYLKIVGLCRTLSVLQHKTCRSEKP